ncbi:hypothetical protein FB561_0380 [Kribbella amoyensis]|uniref:Uncharacterized protein n=1 Tax=Kribbella amoyensis TaxID=996641 RepID=A0A561BKG7_9ACTN|nr:hypothetical protein FB561_0380 [Kribbella amoyensis]
MRGEGALLGGWFAVGVEAVGEAEFLGCRLAEGRACSGSEAQGAAGLRVWVDGSVGEG